jgi:hypothetical protein
MGICAPLVVVDDLDDEDDADAAAGAEGAEDAAEAVSVTQFMDFMLNTIFSPITALILIKTVANPKARIVAFFAVVRLGARG